MSRLQGHIPAKRTTHVFDPSPARRPPLTTQSRWTESQLRRERVFERLLFLRTTNFKIVSRREHGGPAELLRMVFIYGNISYQTQILKDMDWSSLITKTPHGNLPVLWVDHKMYGEPNAIVRHLASHLGLLGKNESERLVVEAVLTQVEEIRDSEFIQKALEETLENRVDDNLELLLEVMVPRNFGFWEQQINSTKGDYLLRSGISLADMSIFDFLKQHVSYFPLEEQLTNFPSLEKLYKLVPLHPNLDAHFGSVSTDSRVSQ